MLKIKNAHIFNHDHSQKADIIIKDGIIYSIEKHNSNKTSLENSCQIIDASGKYVFPTNIDPHVHMHLKTPAGYSSDDFESGSKAAISGGVTHIIDFVTPLRNQSLIDAYEIRKKDIKNCLTDVSFHMGISGWLPDLEYQMTKCVNEFHIQSFKTYLAYKKNIGIDYQLLQQVMLYAKKLDAIVLVHAEEGDLIDDFCTDLIHKNQTQAKYHALSRPEHTEINAVSKVIELVRITNCKTYFVHISCSKSADLIWEAKREGLPIYAETCPQYLLIDDSVYSDDFQSTAPYIFSPPARSKNNVNKLWDHLKNKNTFDVISTDHCPFNFKQKSLGKDNFTLIPNGAGGVEFKFPLLYNYGFLKHGIKLSEIIKLTCYNPAIIFNITDKGYIAEGKNAEILIFNPESKYTISKNSHIQNCDLNIYEGMKIKGKVETVIKNGKIILN